MHESDLDYLVYVSSAVRLLSSKEIEYLLKRARERNKEYGITGVLLQIDGNFMQYIEGPKDNLDIIYKIIREDEQHTGLILVIRVQLVLCFIVSGLVVAPNMRMQSDNLLATLARFGS